MEAPREPEFVSMMVVANDLGVSETTVKAYEKLGVIPVGRRVGGSRARIWPAQELALMRQRVAERRAALNQRVESAAGAAA